VSAASDKFSTWKKSGMHRSILFTRVKSGARARRFPVPFPVPNPVSWIQQDTCRKSGDGECDGRTQARVFLPWPRRCRGKWGAAKPVPVFPTPPPRRHGVEGSGKQEQKGTKKEGGGAREGMSDRYGPDTWVTFQTGDMGNTESDGGQFGGRGAAGWGVPGTWVTFCTGDMGDKPGTWVTVRSEGIGDRCSNRAARRAADALEGDQSHG